MNVVTAQVSLYPLGQNDLSPAIGEALRLFKEHGLTVKPGTMSSVISGEDKAVFFALQSAYQHAAANGRVVMVVTYSNACPLPESELEQKDI